MPDELLWRLLTATAELSRSPIPRRLKLISRNGFNVSHLVSITMSGYGTPPTLLAIHQWSEFK
jgi:hypothetical protein